MGLWLSWLKSNEKQLSDKQIIVGIILGDRKSVDLFLKRYEKLIYNTIHKFRIEHQDVSDTFNDVFIHIIKDNYKVLRQWKSDVPIGVIRNTF